MDGMDRLAEAPSEQRRGWMGVLARAKPQEIAAVWDAVGEKPGFRHLRAPEIGMVMVRGRIGGSGGPFNLGEMTVTRCAVQVEGGITGMSWVAGRDRQHAEVAALLDALLQDDRRRPDLMASAIAPLAEAQAARRAAASGAAASSKVEFFTMVRGE
jgi:alpha-D-ribose 1-methylphosphonate 5-triphosphate synthase subunit PhnG